MRFHLPAGCSTSLLCGAATAPPSCAKTAAVSRCQTGNGEKVVFEIKEATHKLLLELAIETVPTGDGGVASYSTIYNNIRCDWCSICFDKKVSALVARCCRFFKPETVGLMSTTLIHRSLANRQ